MEENVADKKCEHCGAAFVCNAADIKNCQCYAVEISAGAAKIIKEKYADCLCAACIRQIVQKESEQNL